MFSAAAVCALLYAMARSGWPAPNPLWYVTLVPVALAAYRRGGLLPGQVMAGFFSTIFLWQLAWNWRDGGSSGTTAEQVLIIVFLHLFAQLVAGVAASVRKRETLTDAVRGWEALLTRASNLDEAAEFLQAEAKAVTDARGAALLLRHPVDGHWEIAAGPDWISLSPLPEAADAMTLAHWLAAQGTSQMISDLDADPRFESRGADPAAGHKSLLAQPLVASDGKVLAILVLLDRRSRPFDRRDVDRLDDLLLAGGKALEQAGILARTDRALARSVAQLAVIQRTARDLNSALEPAQIAGLTLDCAAELTGADAVLVSTPAVWRVHGVALGDDAAAEIAATGSDLRRPALDPSPPCLPSDLLADASARLVAPIRRGDEGLGVIVAESRRAGAFDGQDLLAVAVLADRAAAALETTRLSDGVRWERGRADQIIHTMADGLLTLDADGRVEMVNLAAEALTGWPADRAAGQLVCDVLGCAGKGSCGATCRLKAAQRDRQTLHDERWLIHMPEGTARVLSLSAAPLPPTETGPGGLVVLLRDVTAQDELERFQRELVAALSHEIHAPLANIDVTVDLLLRAAAGDLSRDGLETIRAQSRRLAELATRTLDVSRLDSGDWQPEPRPLPINLLIDDMAREWQDAQPERALTIEAPDERMWAWADEQAVVGVLNELLSNAVKYSPAGSAIIISAAWGPQGSVTLAVTDEGPGIPAEKQARIFDRFYRADARDNQESYGVGLGLYTARRRVELMGGRIGVTSEPNHGSRFAFTLPALNAIRAAGQTRGDV